MSERKGKLRWVEDYLIAQLKGEKKEGILLDTLTVSYTHLQLQFEHS